MAVKTITIKESAYRELKSLQLPRESFSDTILRIAKRKPLSIFFGVLGKKIADNMEKEIKNLRKRRKEAHLARLKNIVKGLNEA